MKKEIKKIIEEIQKCLKNMSESNFELLEDLLRKGEKIFIAGKGRSGLCGKMFAMRLRQIGYESYVAGETITPSAEENDVVVFVSSSGKRKDYVEIARKIKKKGVKILTITSSKDNPLAKISNFIIEIPKVDSIQFGNSLFEQSVFIFFESFILYLKEKNKISQEEFRKRHTNLE